MIPVRVGIGIDVHRLKKGRKLILGGVEIKHPTGLEGHSDGDVLTHAIIDGLLGGSALDDIGVHFASTEHTYSGVSSLLLLGSTLDKCRDSGWSPVFLDATIIAQSPMLAPHVADMKNEIARVLGLSDTQINIKSTTTDNLGYIGNGEGIACHVVVTMEAT
tara:strand:+ start:86 stop:568 length:483 start_codon:yes stop_codon:yes gene_type:complete